MNKVKGAFFSIIQKSIPNQNILETHCSVLNLKGEREKSSQITEEKYPFPCDPCPSGVRGTSWHTGVASVVIVDKAGSSGDTYPVDGQERRPKGRQCLSRETQKCVAGRSPELQEERPGVFLRGLRRL